MPFFFFSFFFPACFCNLVLLYARDLIRLLLRMVLCASAMHARRRHPYVFVLVFVFMFTSLNLPPWSFLRKSGRVAG
ncbi:hypothetical protein B0T09DRAFT_99595 [Sordaria sp. MPI-SDFR-AT-0083]|nr:hypothetical protein B0T09DRAFT_99595 [Sordaria sp. MPI-SDFR-AT-0083]